MSRVLESSRVSGALHALAIGVAYVLITLGLEMTHSEGTSISLFAVRMCAITTFGLVGIGGLAMLAKKHPVPT